MAVGFRRINKMLQDLAPAFHARAHVEVGMWALQRRGPCASIAPSGPLMGGGGRPNGAYLRQQLEMPVVLVKVGV